MDVFQLRGHLVGEYADFTRSFTRILAGDVRDTVEGASRLAGGGTAARAPAVPCVSPRAAVAAGVTQAGRATRGAAAFQAFRSVVSRWLK